VLRKGNRFLCDRQKLILFAVNCLLRGLDGAWHSPNTRYVSQNNRKAFYEEFTSHIEQKVSYFYSSVFPLCSMPGAVVVAIVWLLNFTTTCAISAYHHNSWEFEHRSWRGVPDTTVCYTICQLLATGRWFTPGNPVSSTNKTDRHDIAEIVL
jgi:hypothetical protein